MKHCRLGFVAFLLASQAVAAVETIGLSCAVAYLPARSTWVRQVELDWDRKRLVALRVDGLTPYSFSIGTDTVWTAIDNERIQIDLRQALWTSDFRGLASGQGRCEVVVR